MVSTFSGWLGENESARSQSSALVLRPVRCTELEIPGLLLIEPRVFRDDRGAFFESYSRDRYADAGLPSEFVQDNHAVSVAGTLRGLHFQRRVPQGKLVRALAGTVYDVAVDLRHGSKTYGEWVGVELSADNALQLFVPRGFAHGYCTVGGPAEVAYKCDAPYVPDDQHGVRWDDPSLAIPWPVASPVLSEKDRGLPVTSEVAPLDVGVT